jgi:hypothetical protein
MTITYSNSVTVGINTYLISSNTLFFNGSPISFQGAGETPIQLSSCTYTPATPAGSAQKTSVYVVTNLGGLYLFEETGPSNSLSQGNINVSGSPISPAGLALKYVTGNKPHVYASANNNVYLFTDSGILFQNTGSYDFPATVVPTLLNYTSPTLYAKAGTDDYSLDLTSNPTSGTFAIVQNLNPVACFNKDTKILCLIDGKEQYLPIQNIQFGTLVKTLKHGFLKTNMLASSRIYNRSFNDRIKNRLYICKPKNYNELIEPLILTGGHSILVDELSLKEKTIMLNYVLKTDDKFRLPSFIDKRAEPFTEEGYFNIYHLSLDANDEDINYGIYANGLLVESCSIRVMKIMKYGSRQLSI